MPKRVTPSRAVRSVTTNTFIMPVYDIGPRTWIPCHQADGPEGYIVFEWDVEEQRWTESRPESDGGYFDIEGEARAYARKRSLELDAEFGNASYE